MARRGVWPRESTRTHGLIMARILPGPDFPCSKSNRSEKLPDRGTSHVVTGPEGKDDLNDLSLPLSLHHGACILSFTHLCETLCSQHVRRTIHISVLDLI